MGKKKKKQLPTFEEFTKAWDENEESMGEMAAFNVTCEQFGISEDDGWDLLADGQEEDGGSDDRVP